MQSWLSFVSQFWLNEFWLNEVKRSLVKTKRWRHHNGVITITYIIIYNSRYTYHNLLQAKYQY